MRVDRGGGREGKCSSLRQTKQNKAELVKKLVKGQLGNEDGPETTAAPPPVLSIDEVASVAMRLVDCGCQLLNRQFDNCQLMILKRSRQEGVEAIIAYTSDFEKLEALERLAKENRGFIYSMVGIHSDMIKRSNDKLPPQRLEALKEACLRPEVLGLIAGLDFARDVGLRYAQLRSLEQQLEIAREVGLPAVLYQVSAFPDLMEKIEAHLAACALAATAAATVAGRVALYNFAGSVSDLASLKALSQVYLILSGRLVTDTGEKGTEFRSALKESFPIERVLICSDSPHSTPQNIEDTFVREGRNEPSNLPFIIKALAEAYSLEVTQAAEIVRANSHRFFGIHGLQEELLSQPAAPSPPDAVKGRVEGKAEQMEEAGSDREVRDDPNDESIKASVAEKKQQVLNEAPVMAKKAIQSYLNQDPDVESRVSYACRGCRSVLFTDADVLSHQDEGATRADFVSSGKTKGGRKGKEDGRCSLYFVRSDLKWMSKEEEGEDGRLDCPCCKAKIGRYDNVLPLACSCGIEVAPPSRGLLKTRLDIIDSSTSHLERAVEANLKLYNEESEEEGSSEEEGPGGKKKKKKQVKGRGNKSNFSNYRNKDLQPKRKVEEDDD